MISNDFNSYLEKYIEGYLFSDLDSISSDIKKDKHPGNGAYLMLSSICSGIEFMGMLLKEDALNADSDHIDTSGAFGHYCKHYLAQIDPRYLAFCELGRELIRNGIAHSFATKGKIGITRVGTREDTHLVRYSSEEIVLINSEYLLEDFLVSYNKYVRPKISKGGELHDRAVKNYEAMRNEYITQVNRTMNESAKKLRAFPWHHKDINPTIDMVEILEVNGLLPLIS